MTRYYLATAGIHGCMAQCTAVGETRTDVARQMAQIHDLGKRRTAQLIHDWYLELDIHRDGNEYIEIVEMDSDNDDPAQYID